MSSATRPVTSKSGLLIPQRPEKGAIETRDKLLEASLTTIRTGLVKLFHKRIDLLPGDIPEADINDYGTSIGFGRTAISLVSHGYVLRKNTKSRQEDLSHRLEVPLTIGPPKYTRYSFDVDYQAVGSASVVLDGTVEIYKNAAAMVEVLSFERDIMRGALNEWEDCVPHGKVVIV